MKKGNTILLLVVLLVIVGLLAVIVTQKSRPGKYDAFAQCLSESGAKFYGAWWCPRCQEQKALFGKSASLIPYVECQTPNSKQTQECNDLGIKGYPTWIFADKTQKTGILDIATLSEKTSCPLE